MDLYEKVRLHYEALQEEARSWRATLDEDEPNLVEQAYAAYLRGRLSFTEAWRVLGYPQGTTIDPFELVQKQKSMSELDADSDLLYEAWYEVNDSEPEYPVPACHH